MADNVRAGESQSPDGVDGTTTNDGGVKRKGRGFGGSTTGGFRSNDDAPSAPEEDKADGRSDKRTDRSDREEGREKRKRQDAVDGEGGDEANGGGGKRERSPKRRRRNSSSRSASPSRSRDRDRRRRRGKSSSRSRSGSRDRSRRGGSRERRRSSDDDDDDRRPRRRRSNSRSRDRSYDPRGPSFPRDGSYDSRGPSYGREPHPPYPPHHAHHHHNGPFPHHHHQPYGQQQRFGGGYHPRDRDASCRLFLGSLPPAHVFVQMDEERQARSQQVRPAPDAREAANGTTAASSDGVDVDIEDLRRRGLIRRNEPEWIARKEVASLMERAAVAAIAAAEGHPPPPPSTAHHQGPNRYVLRVDINMPRGAPASGNSSSNGSGGAGDGTHSFAFVELSSPELASLMMRAYSGKEAAPSLVPNTPPSSSAATAAAVSVALPPLALKGHILGLQRPKGYDDGANGGSRGASASRERERGDSHFARAFMPQAGAAIALSNTRKNAAYVQTQRDNNNNSSVNNATNAAASSSFAASAMSYAIGGAPAYAPAAPATASATSTAPGAMPAQPSAATSGVLAALRAKLGLPPAAPPANAPAGPAPAPVTGTSAQAWAAYASTTLLPGAATGTTALPIGAPAATTNANINSGSAASGVNKQLNDDEFTAMMTGRSVEAVRAEREEKERVLAAAAAAAAAQAEAEAKKKAEEEEEGMIVEEGEEGEEGEEKVGGGVSVATVKTTADAAAPASRFSAAVAAAPTVAGAGALPAAIGAAVALSSAVNPLAAALASMRPGLGMGTSASFLSPSALATIVSNSTANAAGKPGGGALKPAEAAANAAAAAAIAAATAAANSGVPLLGMQSATTSLPAPNAAYSVGAGAHNITVGAIPAAAAGLLGPAGIMGLLASVEPSRILVILNAVTDYDLHASRRGELRDIIADFAVEAHKILTRLNAQQEAAYTAQCQQLQQQHEAAQQALLAQQQAAPAEGETAPAETPAPFVPPPPPADHSLFAIRIPTPQKPGETADIVFTRPVRLNTGSSTLAGGAANGLQPQFLLEDARQADRSKVMTKTAASFFNKVLKAGATTGSTGSYGIGAVNVAGLLTNGPGGASNASSSSSSSSSSFSSFYSETAANAEGNSSTALITAEAAAATNAGAAALVGAGAGEGDKGDGYDPLEGRTRGLGKIFLEFSSMPAAVAVQQEMSGRAFNGRILVTSFVRDEDAYRRGKICDFNACLP